jgi:hypothetical protein
MNKPITSRIQQSTQGGMKVTKPILNVGVGCCTKCGSPAKMYDKSPSKFTPELKKASEEGKLTGKFKAAVDAAPVKYGKSMAKKKGCKSKKY